MLCADLPSDDVIQSSDDVIWSSDDVIQSLNEEENEVEKCVRLGSLQVR